MTYFIRETNKFKIFLENFNEIKSKYGDVLITVNHDKLEEFIKIFNANNAYQQSLKTNVINYIESNYIINFQTRISKFINMFTLLFNKLISLEENNYFFELFIIIPQIFCIFPCLKKKIGVDYTNITEPISIHTLLETNPDALPKFLKEYNTLDIEDYLKKSREPKEKQEITNILIDDNLDIYDLAIIDNTISNLTRERLINNLNNENYNNSVILRGNYIIDFLLDSEIMVDDKKKNIQGKLVSGLINHISKGFNVYVVSLQSRNSITGLGNQIPHSVKGYDDLFILDQLINESVKNIYTHDSKIIRESIIEDNSTMDMLNGNVYEVTIFKLIIKRGIYLFYNDLILNDFYKVTNYDKNTYMETTPIDKIITLRQNFLTDFSSDTVLDTISSNFIVDNIYNGTVISSSFSKSGNEFCNVKVNVGGLNYIVNVYCNGRTGNQETEIKFVHKWSNRQGSKPNFSIVTGQNSKSYRKKYLKYKNKYLLLKKEMLLKLI